MPFQPQHPEFGIQSEIINPVPLGAPDPTKMECSCLGASCDIQLAIASYMPIGDSTIRLTKLVPPRNGNDPKYEMLGVFGTFQGGGSCEKCPEWTPPSSYLCECKNPHIDIGPGGAGSTAKIKLPSWSDCIDSDEVTEVFRILLEPDPGGCLYQAIISYGRFELFIFGPYAFYQVPPAHLRYVAESNQLVIGLNRAALEKVCRWGNNYSAFPIYDTFRCAYEPPAGCDCPEQCDVSVGTQQYTCPDGSHIDCPVCGDCGYFGFESSDISGCTNANPGIIITTCVPVGNCWSCSYSYPDATASC